MKSFKSSVFNCLINSSSFALAIISIYSFVLVSLDFKDLYKFFVKFNIICGLRPTHLCEKK
jgi:hypothetical protein